ncbi:Chromodomain Y-like protein, partial [Stegodyphus mimosarum]
MQKNSSKEMHNMTFGKNVSSKSESGRKRRSEVEKLYDSLHEIEWAKNFSPDNILRQINIRQAASCSAFGRSPSKPSTSKPHRKSKGNVKSEQNVANDKVPSETPNPDSNHKNEISSSGVHVTCAKSEAAVSDSSISKSQQKTKEYLSSNLHQSEDVLTDSDGMKSFVKENFVSHVSSQDGLNPSEISCSKSSETTCDKLVKTTNKVECLDDAQLSSASDDSVVSGNTMELIAKNFLDFDFKCHSNSGSVLDYSVTPTFFDIAEEGIRTIDACFREVGAEVVVSTCYDEECGLPLLTSVKDSQIPDKRSFLDEGPPVLEPCIVLQNENSQLAGSSKENEGILNHNPDKFLEHKLGKIYNKTANNKNGLHNGSKSSNICKITRHAELLQLWKKFRSIHSASKFMNNPLIMYAAKRILNKYVKYLRYRAKLHRLPTFKTCRYSEKSTEQINKLNSVSTDRTCEKSAEKSNVLNSLPVNKISFEKSLEHNDSLNSAISSVSNEKCTEQKLISFVSRRTPDEKIIEPLNSLNSSVKKKEITELANTNEKNAQHVNTLNSASINRTSSLIIIKEEMLHKNHVSITSSFKSQELGERSVGEPKKSTTFLKTFNGKLTLQDYSDGMVFDRCKNGSVLFHSEKEHCKPLPGTSKTESVTSSTSKSAGCSLLQQREHTLAPSSCKAVTSSKVETDECTKHDEDENVPRPTSFGFSCHYKTIRVNRNNRYTQVVLKLTRGKSIFLTLEALIELRDVVNRTGNDSNCQVLILNGIGDSFCLGLDLKPLVGPRKIKASTEMAVAVKELIEALSDFKKPLVAVVNGPAYGLGLTILNHADVTIASHTATFCMPYSFLGYIPEGGATLTLPQAVGATVAMDLLLRGRILTAREAHAIGLINHVLEAKLVPEELVSKVKVLAENSLSALETTKALVKMRLHLELSQVLETEVQMLPRMWLSAACQDALQNALRTGILAE